MIMLDTIFTIDSQIDSMKDILSKLICCCHITYIVEAVLSKVILMKKP